LGPFGAFFLWFMMVHDFGGQRNGITSWDDSPRIIAIQIGSSSTLQFTYATAWYVLHGFTVPQWSSRWNARNMRVLIALLVGYPPLNAVCPLWEVLDMLQYLPNSIKMIHIFIYPIDYIYHHLQWSRCTVIRRGWMEINDNKYASHEWSVCEAS
jgi:carbon starvation protein CstA